MRADVDAEDTSSLRRTTKPYMPVWRGVISKTQVSDLIAYLRAGLPAVPTAESPSIPQRQGAAVEGAVLYSAYGCITVTAPTGSAAYRTRSRPT